MKNIIKKIATTGTIALTATVITGATPAPASAQVVELLSVAGSALSSLGNRNQPQPQPQTLPPTQAPVNRTVTLGTGNMNGNNVHLCLASCPPPAPQAPRPVMPLQVRPQNPGVPTVQSNQQIVRNGVPVPPQGIRPSTPISPQAQVQPPAPRPTVIIPPIRLPINLPR
jgi:hypothetical protein